MTISNQLKDQLRKVLWITLAWTIISFFQFAMGYSILQRVNCVYGSEAPLIYLKGSIFTGINAGLIGGGGIVFLWEKWLRNKHYGRALLSIFLSFCVIYGIVTILTNTYFVSQQKNLTIIDPLLWRQVGGFIGSFEQIVNFFFWLSVVVATLVMLQVNDKYGPGVFKEFLLGRYFNPKREERIFMFLDLRSSTSIAEQLGEESYFNFLNDVFKFSTPSILQNLGEIYQYVGDEIVISWRMQKGTDKANCIQCFFDIQTALRQKGTYFQEKYGVIPEFKAGLHYGNVMAGEIGVVKRDIVFSGDVLNTTARIQSKCNELGVNILLSKYLLDKLTLPPHTFIPKKIGDMLLRGKQQSVILYTV